MNLIKKSLLVALIMLTQSQETLCLNPVKAFFGTVLAIPTGRAAYVWLRNRELSKELDILKKIGKSLGNTRVNSSIDKPEEIAKKWSMKAWRIKKGVIVSNDVNFFIPDANYVYINEPRVVACLYNDLGFEEIFLVKNRELLSFSFCKPTKTSYKVQDKDGKVKPLTLFDSEDVPTVDTLKAVRESIQSDMKKLFANMQDLEKVKKLSVKKGTEYSDTSLSKLLIDICKTFQKTDVYKNFIEIETEAIENGDFSDNYKEMQKDRLSVFKSLDIADVTDLFLFNYDHFFKDTKNGDDLKLASIENQFTVACKDAFNAQKENSIYNCSFINDSYDTLKLNCPGIENFLSIDAKQSEELVAELARTYLKVLVSYVRLVLLEKVVSKAIDMANGFEDKLSPEALIRKDKEKVTKEIEKIIKVAKDLQQKTLIHNGISYMDLEEAVLKIKESCATLGSYKLVKLYGNVSFQSTLTKILTKMRGDIVSLFNSYFGSSPAMKNDDDEDDIFSMLGGGGRNRPANRPNAFVAGDLGQDGLKTLNENCKGWLVGLEKLEEQSKL